MVCFEDLSKSWGDNNHTDIHGWLNEMGFYRKHIIRDSDSLFRATSDAMFATQRLYKCIKKQCVEAMIFGKNKFNWLMNECIEDYAKKLSDGIITAGFKEISVMNVYYRRDFVIIDAHYGPNFTFCKNLGNTIYLFYQSNIHHFDVLLPLDCMKTAAFCQSFAYRFLYEGVFAISCNDIETKILFSDYDNAPDSENNHGDNKTIKKVNRGKMYDSSNSSEPNELNLKEKGNRYSKYNCTINLNYKKTVYTDMFSQRIVRGLVSHIYKNIEYDNWFEKKREKMISSNYNDGITLQVGVKCLCRIKPEQIIPYVCYIQSMKTNGPCDVYIEELGEKKTVQFNQLEPIPLNEAKPWYSNKKGKVDRKYIKRKKNYQNYFSHQNKAYFKTRVIENKITAEYDANNNINTEVFPSVLKKHPIMDKGNKEYNDNLNSHKYLKKYTEMNYHDFKPHTVDFITLPFTVDHNDSPNNINTTHDSPLPNRQPVMLTFPSTTTAGGNNLSSPDVNGSITSYASNPGTSTTNSLITVQSSTVVQCGANSCTSTYPNPIYCVPPVPVSTMRPPASMHYPIRVPLWPAGGINFNAQRSISSNGSDLPFSDVATLQYFYNLGIDCLQSMMSGHPLPPFLPPAAACIGNYSNCYYQPAMTPNQLALEMHNNLNLEDTPNVLNSTQDQTKMYNNHQSIQKNGGGKPFDYRGNRSVNNQRYRKNDCFDKNNARNNGNMSRSNGTFHNKKNGSFRNNNFNESSHINNDKKDFSQEQNQTPRNSPPVTPNVPFTSFPPPYYRVPYCHIDNESNMVNTGYPPNYIPYSTPTVEEGTMGPLIDGYIPPPPGAPPIMTYISPGQFYYNPNIHNYSTNNTPPQNYTENSSK